jgi:TP901 family phage tail tape measure protein
VGRTVSVKLMAEVSQFTREVGGRAVGAVKELGGELDKAAQKGKLDRLTTGTAAVGVGLLGIAAGAVKMRMDFDKSMSAVSAATHAPQDELDKLRNAAIKAGKDTQFSATAAADGITELGKAGVSTDDILSGGLKGALDLAAAGQLSVAEAAETSASALTQFKLQGSAVPHVADLLAAAAGKAQGSVHDMGYALNQSGLVASQFGLSIEDTTGVLGEFASAGLIGSDAGTSFKTMLLAMANPSDITKGKMDELGISFYDTQGKFIGLNGVAQVLQHTLGGLTEEQRNAALGQIFGNDAIRAATVLYKDGAQGVTDWKNKVNDSGYAASTAAKLTDNLAGDLERLKGSLETVAIQSGGGASDGLRKLTQGANGAVNAFADLPGWVQQSVTVLSGVGGASLLAAAGFLKARGTAKDFMDELRDMGPRGSAVASGLGKITGIAGKLGLVGVAAVGVYTGMKLVGDWVDHFTAPTVRDVDKMTDSLAKFAATGQATGELSKTFGANMSGLTRDLDDLRRAQAEVAKINDLADKGGGNVGRDRAMAALGGRIKDMTDQAKADLAALDQALANLVSNGNVTAAKTAFDAFARSTGLSLDKLPKYAAAAQNAATANTGLAAGFGDAKANADTMTQSLDAALQAGQKLTDVFDQLHGAVISVDKANLNAAQAIDAVREAFKANGKSVDESGQRYDKHGKAVKLSSDKLAENSEKALKNRVAVGQAAQAAAKAAEAKYEETGSVTAASKTYDHYIDQLRKTLGQSHLTEGEIDRLIHSYATMPPSVATKITAPGAVQAKKQIDEAHAAAKLLDGQYQIALKTTGQGKVESELRKLSSMQQALKSANTIARLGGSGDGPGFSGGGYTGPGARRYQPGRGGARRRVRGDQLAVAGEVARGSRSLAAWTT